MRAMCCRAYGTPDVLELRTLPKPEPRDDEVLIRIRAASVTPGDCETRRFDFPFWIWLPLRLLLGVLRPRPPVIGMEFSGAVEAAGKKVARFKPGDAVFATTGLPFGAYAEYRCQRESSTMAKKPEGIRHADAANLGVGGLNALHYLRAGKVKAGDKLLINGAGGCFGTYAVQLAKHFGAEVTGVDSADNLDVVRRLGADHVIDYRTTDFTANGRKYDVIFDVTGKAHYGRCLRSLERQGRLVLANPRFLQLFRAPLTSLVSDRKVAVGFCKERPEDLEYLADLMATGSLKAAIDRTFPLEKLAEAHRYVESGAKIGHVTIDV